MTWETILKLKSKRWHKVTDRIMSDGKYRSGEEVRDAMFEDIENNPRVHTTANVPRTSAIKRYFKMSSKYEEENGRYKLK